MRSPASVRRDSLGRCKHGLKIYLVDGSLVRDQYDSDFSQGGNGQRYDFIPRDELWIDACLPEREWPHVVRHECRETELMRRGKTYSQAHDIAKRIEDRERKAQRT